MSIPTENNATKRLYHHDSLLLQFRARVVGHSQFGQRPSVLLDETAFYPEAGGQMADRGQLAGSPIADVQVDEHGSIHHIFGSEILLPEIGSEVEGQVDRARRRAHMALHTGQHMLSRALLDVAKADTVSARLGETAATIDVGAGTLSERDLANAEALVNSVVDADVTVRAWFPSPSELASLVLRREPKVDSDVRIVEVAEFDLSPCGGTHCTRSSQVGLIRVLSIERYKGGHRITFEAGERARAVLATHSEALRNVSQALACAPMEAAAAVTRLRAELKSAKDAEKSLKERLGTLVAESLLANGIGPYVLALDEGDIELLRAIARKLVTRPNAIALLAARSEAGLDIVVSRGASATLDCGALVKRLAAETNGRGGGRGNHAEGRLPEVNGPIDWYKLATASLASMAHEG